MASSEVTEILAQIKSPKSPHQVLAQIKGSPKSPRATWSTVGDRSTDFGTARGHTVRAARAPLVAILSTDPGVPDRTAVTAPPFPGAGSGRNKAGNASFSGALESSRRRRSTYRSSGRVCH